MTETLAGHLVESPPAEMHPYENVTSPPYSVLIRSCPSCGYRAASVWGVPPGQHYCVRDGKRYQVTWV